MDAHTYQQQLLDSPVYRPLQTITREVASLLDALSVGVESLCGFYLTTEQRNRVVCDVSNMLLDTARRHGFEDSKSVLTPPIQVVVR
ncbi:hypothetical protein BH10PLA2_BH10PLA2_00390 [soil metagenome]